MSKIILSTMALDNKKSCIKFIDDFIELNKLNFNDLKKIDSGAPIPDIIGYNDTEVYKDLILPDGWVISGYENIVTLISKNGENLICISIAPEITYDIDLEFMGKAPIKVEEYYKLDKIIPEKQYLLERACIITENENINNNTLEVSLYNIIRSSTYNKISNTENVRERLKNKVYSWEINKLMFDTLLRNNIITYKDYNLPDSTILSLYCKYIRSKVVVNSIGKSLGMNNIIT